MCIFEVCPGLAESYGEYARKLAEEGRMPSSLAEDIARLDGLRNILVHRYLETSDVGKLYNTVKEVVDRIVVSFVDRVKNLNH